MSVCVPLRSVSHCTPVTEESHHTQVHVSLVLCSLQAHTREDADCPGVVMTLWGRGGSGLCSSKKPEPGNVNASLFRFPHVLTISVNRLYLRELYLPHFLQNKSH